MKRVQRAGGPRSLARQLLVASAACAALLGGAGVRPAVAADAVAVDRAIGRGTDFLYARQSDGLQWEEVGFGDREPDRDPQTGNVIGPLMAHTVRGGQWGGRTALCTYALLACGQPETDERVRRAVDFLRRADLVGTYAVSLRALVWSLLPQREENRQAMARDARLLMTAMQGNAPLPGKAGNKPRLNAGLFDYLPDETDHVDLSAGQYGLLGLWAASRSGWEVPANYWQAAETAWTRWQQPDGGWAYHGSPLPAGGGNPPYPTTLSITAAGVASLYLTLDALHANDGVRCNGNVTNAGIDRGLAYLGYGLPDLLDKRPYPDDPVDRIRIEGNPGGGRYYTLFGIERIGVASGLKYLGGLDWYEAGADWLLDKQHADGSWGNEQDTAFALLFLARGREPVMANKLIYRQAAGRARPGAEPPREVGRWNQRPRDVANLASFIGESTERTLNWQSLSLRAGRRGLLELADAPLLYLAGDGEPSFTDAELQTLRDYVYAGGLILGNADCGRDGFERGFQKLGRDLFPGLEFRVIEDSHPIYTQGQFPMADVRRKTRLMGLGNGAREFMVLVPGDDLARDWQLNNQRNDAAFKVGTNLYLYATDKRRQPEKGRTTLVFPDAAVTAKRAIKVARVKYDGRWDPEPGGWTRLAAVLHNEAATDLDVVPVDLATTDLAGFKVAHLTGTAAINLPEAQGAKLKAFVDGGGLLVVDAAGGNSAFLQSVETLLRGLFPEAAAALAEVVPPSDPLYAGGPTRVKTVEYRLAAKETLGDETLPRLRMIRGKNGGGVVLSNEDLSVGLNGSPVAGVVGYVPEDATRLMESILLYVAK